MTDLDYKVAFYAVLDADNKCWVFSHSCRDAEEQRDRANSGDATYLQRRGWTVPFHVELLYVRRPLHDAVPEPSPSRDTL